MHYKELYMKLISGKEDKQDVKEETYDVIYKLVFRIVKDDEETIKIVNQIYERLFLNIQYIKEPNLLMIYIYLISRETLREYFHKEHNGIYFIDDKLQVDDIQNLENKIEYIYHEILNIINDLPEEYKEPCLLLIQGYSIKEIANKMEVHESTIKIKIVHAGAYVRKQIRKNFQEA